MPNRLRTQSGPQIPDYLERHFWWAYLWPRSAPFFDHPAVISAILFGHYRLLMAATMKRLAALKNPGRMLQLTCVYGKLTPQLQRLLAPEPLHVTDIVPLQLELARDKCSATGALLATRMNAEKLGYGTGVFDTALIFFLLHELPPPARRRVLAECLRTLAPGATLLITEYSERPERHWFARHGLFRKLLLRAEPFLEDFWHEDLDEVLREQAATHQKTVTRTHSEHHFRGFYRVIEYRVDAAPQD